jgi:hypothetical protein
MSRQGNQTSATEQTRLLLPSAHSTDRPSKDRLVPDVEQTQPLLSSGRAHASEVQPQAFEGKNGRKEGFYDYWAGKSGLKSNRIARFGCIGVIVALLALVTWKGAEREGPFGPTRPLPYNKDSISEFHGTVVGSKPLSLLDPVEDLDLPSAERPHDSRPGRALKASGQQALPTNAWYQNMIMVGIADPNPLNRVYTVPYIVDASGPIAGLRVHNNHIGASTSVVQVYTVEEYGLTIGAWTDATIDIRTNESKTYTVKQMTELGLTLEWVRFITWGLVYEGILFWATLTFQLA